MVMSRVRSSALMFAVGALAAVRATSGQIVIHDTRAAVTGGTWNNYAASYIGGISGESQGGIPHDQQAADDFIVTQRIQLTSVLVDFIAELSPLPPTQGLLVEIFSNLPSNLPTEIPIFSTTILPTEIITMGTFPLAGGSPGNAGTIPNYTRLSWRVDFTQTVILDPGTWWISMVPIDESPFGGLYHWVGTTVNSSGFVSPFRCGGVDHGNSYPCHNATTNTRPDWSASLAGFGGRPRTLSMRIEGQLPQGACCNSTTCGVVSSAAECIGGTFQGDGTTCSADPANPTTCCPANFNGTNGLSVQDIFDFLAAYFGGVTQADFNQTGGITVQDIFDFLAAYFGGC